MANGRLGFKCIPAYSSCEIYQNSSSSEASISILAQGLNVGTNNSITVALGTTTYSTMDTGNIATGTNLFKDTSAIQVTGTGQTDARGAFIQSSSGIGGTVPTRINAFQNIDGTRTDVGTGYTALRSPAAYGGSEVVLPGDGMHTKFCEYGGVPDCYSHRDGFITMDCHGIFPLFIGACNYNCNYETAAALMVNPNCECGTTGSAFDCNCRLSIKCQSLCGLGINPCNIYGDCSCCYIIAPNHYAAGFYQPTRVSSGEVRANQYCFMCTDSTNPTYCAADYTQLPWVGFYASCCCLYYSADHCKFCMLSPYPLGGNGDPDGWFGFYSLSSCRWCCRSSCCGIAGFDMMAYCTGSSLGGSFFACDSHCRCGYNLSGGYSMSPYGVARAATYGVSFFAYQNNNQVTTYLKLNPSRWWNKNLYLCCGCQCTDWEAFHICTPCCCEYPIKYVAHNPKAGVEKTYFMVRSGVSDDCGIFEYKWDLWTGAGCKRDTCCMSCDNSGLRVYSCCLTGSDFIEKVADFPSAMASGKYTTPRMCVGCLYRMSPKENPFWSITIYNHSTTEWDRFTSTDLITWTSVAPDFSWRPTTRAKFETFDNCITRYNNVFPSTVPKCGYTDFGVSANNFERTGVVISAGENVTVDNDSSDALTVQVWGYEG
jgi:hypothetical protein